MAQKQRVGTGLGGPVSHQTTADGSPLSDLVVASIPHLDAEAYFYDPAHRHAAIDGPSAAAYAGLRSRIDELRRTNGVHSLQLASSNPEEGTSTVAVHLAAALAADGTDVVLIDANLRRPRLRELFELDGRAGLADVILGRARLVDVMYEIDDAEGLVIVPAGVVSQNPAYLMVDSATEDRMVTLAQILRSLAGLGYFVIVDSPAVLMVTDALAMAHSVDALLVVSNSTSRSSDLARAQKLLGQVDAPICGRVVVHSTAQRTKSADDTHRGAGSRLRAALGLGQAKPPKSTNPPASGRPSQTDIEPAGKARVALTSPPVEPAPPAIAIRPSRPIADRPSLMVKESPAPPQRQMAIVPPMPPSPNLGRPSGLPASSTQGPVGSEPTTDPTGAPVLVTAPDAILQPAFLSRTITEPPTSARPHAAFPPIPAGPLAEYRSRPQPVDSATTPQVIEIESLPDIVAPIAADQGASALSPRPPIPPPPPPPPPAPVISVSLLTEQPVRRGRARRHRVLPNPPAARTPRR